MEATEQPVARLWRGTEEHLLYAGQTLKLGRAAENDITLDDPKVSRSHAMLEWNGTGFTLRDFGSINGTYVNEQRLADAARLLRDGDHIRLGNLPMRYEIVRAPAVEQPQDSARLALTEPLQQMGPCLRVTAGPDMGQEYPLWGETIIIGRASREATWEIRLTDRAVSRPHARLERRLDGYYLLDLESANGTLLNDVPLHGPVLLAHGDTIALGETRLEMNLR